MATLCPKNDDHDPHDEGPRHCPGLPHLGFGVALASLPWNLDRPDREALAIEADGTGPAAAAARAALRTTPDGQLPVLEIDGRQLAAALIAAGEILRDRAGRPRTVSLAPPTDDQPYDGPHSIGVPDSFTVPPDAEVVIVLGADGAGLSIMSRNHLDTPAVAALMHRLADDLARRHKEWIERGLADAHEPGDGLTSIEEDGARYIVAGDGHRYGPFPPMPATTEQIPWPAGLGGTTLDGPGPDGQTLTLRDPEPGAEATGEAGPC